MPETMAPPREQGGITDLVLSATSSIIGIFYGPAAIISAVGGVATAAIAAKRAETDTRRRVRAAGIIAEMETEHIERVASRWTNLTARVVPLAAGGVVFVAFVVATQGLWGKRR